MPVAVPAAEVLKQILEQMLENERRRVRNEFIRISALFLALVLLIMGGGFWMARHILLQVKETRLLSDHSQEALAALLASPDLQALSLSGAADWNLLTDDPELIQQTIAELEEKNLALAQLMQSGEADFNHLLEDVFQTRQAEIQALKARLQAQLVTAPKPPPVKLKLANRPVIKSLTAPAAHDM
ncbi:MAG: hypothetical protein GX806_01420, partial [Lentisphaerae bacterium]|nr:hypothetical protein [Lentisphaerota bacterium]